MRTKKDFDRQNEYNKEQYDRVSLMLPKGMKPMLQGIAKREGTSLNEIIKRSIQNYIIASWNVPQNVPPSKSEQSASEQNEPQAKTEQSKK